MDVEASKNDERSAILRSSVTEGKVPGGRKKVAARRGSGWHRPKTHALK